MTESCIIIGLGQIGMDYDYYQCDAPKAEISPNEISDDSDSIANAKQKCLNRGLQTGTEEFGECVLKLSK